MRSFIIKPGDLIPIGRAGENQATQIRFDVTGWADTFGAGTYTLVVKRPHEDTAYPVEVTTDGDYVVWTVSNVDTGIAGNASVQLRYVVDGALAKSVIYTGIVGESLDNIVDPPDPFEDLIQRMVDLAERTEAAAESAAGSAASASESAETATAAKTAAQTAAQAAQTAQGTATQAAQTATQAKDAAQAAQQAAEAAKAAAAQSATAASGSATAAAGSAAQAAASATAADASADAAQAVLDSIPADYSELSTDVDGLKKDLGLISDRSKNLLPIENINTNPFGVSVNYNNGVLTISGTASGSAPAASFSACSPVKLAAGAYTFSRSAAAGQTILRKVVGSATTNIAVLMGTTNSTTFTLSGETTLYLYLGLTSGGTYSHTLNLQLEAGGTKTDWVAPSLEAVDAKSRAEIAEIGLPYEDLSLTWTAGKAFSASAGWVNNTGWSYADVTLTQGQTLVIDSIVVNPTVYGVSVWALDEETILKTCFPLPAESGTLSYRYTCSSQVERVRLNTITSQISAFSGRVYTPNKLVNTSNILVENNRPDFAMVLRSNIIAIGDSLTIGSYTGSDTHRSQSYPAFLAKMIGASVENAGRGGWSASEWWAGDPTTQKGFPYYNYSDYDTAVICLGTNGGLTDTLDTDVTPYSDYADYADTNTGNYCKIIQGIKAQNADIVIFLCTIWGGGGSPGVSVTNEVIGKIAAMYGLVCIDLNPYFLTAYSQYHAVSGNLHLGRIGYAKMADVIHNSLNADVLNRPSLYNFIPTN